MTRHPAWHSSAAESRPISPLPMTTARFPPRPPSSRCSSSTARLAAETGTWVSRTRARTSFPAATAQRNKVSSRGSAAPASRPRVMASFTWEMIWSSPQMRERSPAATSSRWRAAASPDREAKAAP